MSKSTAPECIVLSSDSDDEKKSRDDFSNHKNKPKLSSYVGTSSANIKSEPDPKNPIISQKISVNNDTLTVKFVTKLHNNFSERKSHDAVPNTRLSKSKAIQRIEASNKRRIELRKANELGGSKFMLGGIQSSNHNKFVQSDSEDSSDAEIVEVKKSKGSNFGVNTKNYRPPETVKQFFPMIPLGKQTAIFNKRTKPNLLPALPISNSNVDLVKPNASSNANLMQSKLNFNPNLMKSGPNLFMELNKPVPNLDASLLKSSSVTGSLKSTPNSDANLKKSTLNSDAGLKKSKPSSEANLTKLKPMSLADMPDVKHLIDVYEKYSKDDDDKLVAKLFQKKMRKVLVNSIAEYEDLYQSYVLLIRRKIANNPSKTHLHLREFVDEIKKCKKSSLEVPLSVAPPSNTFSEPKASTSKELDDSNLTSLGITPDAKIAVLETKMKILNKKITELQNKDIPLEEMDDNSPYVLIEKYEKKYMQLLNCYRKLTDSPASALRSVDKNFKFRGSRYSEFNSAVGKLVRRLKPDLPDYSDLYGLACKCNRRFIYRLNDCDVKYLARNTLDQVVEEIKRRRGYDFNISLDMWMDFNGGEQPGPDPAKTDENLKAQLKKNSLLAREKTEEIMKHYVEKQEEFEKQYPEQHKKLMEHGEDDDNDEEEEEDDEDEASDSESIDKEISEEIHNQNDETVEETATFPDDENLPSCESATDTGDSSEKTDEESFSDLGEFPPSPNIFINEVNESSTNASSLKIVSVEGAGNLFYSCESSPHKNYIFKSTDDAEDSEVVTLD